MLGLVFPLLALVEFSKSGSEWVWRVLQGRTCLSESQVACFFMLLCFMQWPGCAPVVFTAGGVSDTEQQARELVRESSVSSGENKLQKVPDRVGPSHPGVLHPGMQPP